MRVSRFDWDEGNEEHVGRHGVEPSEAEEVLRRRPHVRRSRHGTLLAYGSTADGRPLLVVFALRSGGVARVVTARDLTANERTACRRRMR